MSRKLTIPASKPLPSQGLEIPRNRNAHLLLKSILREEVFYPQIRAADRAGRATGIPFDEFVQTPAGRRYSIASPDPWLLAIAGTIWEGIIQGLTWETIKVTVEAVLAYLRANGAAPPAVASSRKRTTDVKFRWTIYGSDGRRIHGLYLRLKRASENRTVAERREVLNELRPKAARRRRRKQRATKK